MFRDLGNWGCAFGASNLGLLWGLGFLCLGELRISTGIGFRMLRFGLEVAVRG